MSKNLLNENQVRRFMKLAEIGSLSESFVDENIEEGGAAARVGNEDRDVGKGRMTADRIREEEEVSEGEDVIEEVSWEDVPGIHVAGKVSRATSAPTRAIANTITKGAKALGDAVTGRPGAAASRGFAAGGVGREQGTRTSPNPDTRTSPNPDTRTSAYAPELDQVSIDEAQMRKLVHRIKARIMQENRHVQRLTHREQQIRLVEAQMARNVERNMAVQNREALTEALIHRVVSRLKGSKK